MSHLYEIISLTPENYRGPGCACFLNPKNEGHQIKLDWLEKRFREGMTIKQLFIEGEIRAIGFIEYVPGEYAWRAVDAKDFLFIHCLWITPNKYRSEGYGSLLVKETLKDANSLGRKGVAVITSEGSFMTGKDLFLKNGFTSVESAPPSFELMVKADKKAVAPKFKDHDKALEKYKGLNIVYSNQCPWVARSIPELIEASKKEGLDINITELKTARDAQEAPSVYATFNLIIDGRLLADHYISTKRFLNILRKEIKK